MTGERGSSHEHPVEQPIQSIDIYVDADRDPVFFAVGRLGVTRIEATVKSGMHADIPYVRVWKGDVCLAEYCQHNILGVYFAEPSDDHA